MCGDVRCVLVLFGSRGPLCSAKFSRGVVMRGTVWRCLAVGVGFGVIR